MRGLILTLVLATASLSRPSLPAHGRPLVQQAAACGVERWPVKVLADDDAASVDPLDDVSETVAELVHLPAPASLPERNRLAPVELTTYSIAARLVEAKLEPDADIHLIIADPSSGDTMITELPDADHCALTADPGFVAKMDAARSTFVAQFGLPPNDRFLPIGAMAHVTGVGFFDFVHEQRGVAPNGIELHPVLGLSVESSAVASPATPATAPGTVTAPSSAPPAAATALQPVPLPSSGEVNLVSVSGGGIGGTATLVVQAPPGASCTITYTTPAGTLSTAAGLVPRTANTSGQVSWTWTIGSSTRPGMGSVTVSCLPGGSVTTPITIG